MFEIDYRTMKIKMHRGDTAAFCICAEKGSGDPWGVHDRMIFTVTDNEKNVMIQRYYRLDTSRTSVDLPDGVVLIELHNSDTDQWPVTTYSTELRFVSNAVWTGGSEVTDDMVDVKTIPGRITEGVPVETSLQSTLELRDVLGEV